MLHLLLAAGLLQWATVAQEGPFTHDLPFGTPRRAEHPGLYGRQHQPGSRQRLPNQSAQEGGFPSFVHDSSDPFARSADTHNDPFSTGGPVFAPDRQRQHPRPAHEDPFTLDGGIAGHVTAKRQPIHSQFGHDNFHRGIFPDQHRTQPHRRVVQQTERRDKPFGIFDSDISGQHNSPKNDPFEPLSHFGGISGLPSSKADPFHRSPPHQQRNPFNNNNGDRQPPHGREEYAPQRKYNPQHQGASNPTFFPGPDRPSEGPTYTPSESPFPTDNQDSSRPNPPHPSIPQFGASLTPPVPYQPPQRHDQRDDRDRQPYVDPRVGSQGGRGRYSPPEGPQYRPGQNEQYPAPGPGGRREIDPRQGQQYPNEQYAGPESANRREIDPRQNQQYPPPNERPYDQRGPRPDQQYAEPNQGQPYNGNGQQRGQFREHPQRQDAGYNGGNPHQGEANQGEPYNGIDQQRGQFHPQRQDAGYNGGNPHQGETNQGEPYNGIDQQRGQFHHQRQDAGDNGGNPHQGEQYQPADRPQYPAPGTDSRVSNDGSFPNPSRPEDNRYQGPPQTGQRDHPEYAGRKNNNQYPPAPNDQSRQPNYPDNSQPQGYQPDVLPAYRDQPSHPAPGEQNYPQNGNLPENQGPENHDPNVNTYPRDEPVQHPINPNQAGYDQANIDQQPKPNQEGPYQGPDNVATNPQDTYSENIPANSYPSPNNGQVHPHPHPDSPPQVYPQDNGAANVPAHDSYSQDQSQASHDSPNPPNTKPYNINTPPVKGPYVADQPESLPHPETGPKPKLNNAITPNSYPGHSDPSIDNNGNQAPESDGAVSLPVHPVDQVADVHPVHEDAVIHQSSTHPSAAHQPSIHSPSAPHQPVLVPQPNVAIDGYHPHQNNHETLSKSPALNQNGKTPSDHGQYSPAHIDNTPAAQGGQQAFPGNPPHPAPYTHDLPQNPGSALTENPVPVVHKPHIDPRRYSKFPLNQYPGSSSPVHHDIQHLPRTDQVHVPHAVNNVAKQQPQHADNVISDSQQYPVQRPVVSEIQQRPSTQFIPPGVKGQCFQYRDLSSGYKLSDNTFGYPEREIAAEVQTKPYLAPILGFKNFQPNQQRNQFDFNTIGIGIYSRRQNADNNYLYAKKDYPTGYKEGDFRAPTPRDFSCRTRTDPLRMFELYGGSCWIVNPDYKKVTLKKCSAPGDYCGGVSSGKKGRCSEDYDWVEVWSYCEKAPQGQRVKPRRLYLPVGCSCKLFYC